MSIYKVDEIKKFKNGKLAFRVDWDAWYVVDLELQEDYYHDIMTMSDLYLNQINGYMFLVDFNTNLVYELGSYLLQNPLKFLLGSIMEQNKEGKAFYMYPLSKTASKELLQDLENGY